MTEEILVSRSDGLIQAEVDDELVALHVEQGSCYGFNPTATRIWALIETPQSLSALTDKLLEEYEVDRQTCEEQVRAVLESLEQDGLVQLKRA